MLKNQHGRLLDEVLAQCDTAMLKTQHDNLLTELLALCDPEHPDYLCLSFTDAERRFLEDLDDRRIERGDLFLTDKQSNWLRAIHADAQQQITTAKALAPHYTLRLAAHDQRTPR